MKPISLKRAALAAALVASTVLPAHAQLRITEVHPSGSGNGTYGADWFEVTNIGAAAVTISNLWKMDDSSNSFASGVFFRGATVIAPNASAVFLEGDATGTTDVTIRQNFNNAWFGTPTSTVNLGFYGGSGVGLSTGGDAVNVFDNSGVLAANVSFAAATAGRTFDNAAKLNNASISQLSTAGVNGAFVSFNGAEIGSPGLIANPVPEPETYALMLAGLGVMAFVTRRRQKHLTAETEQR